MSGTSSFCKKCNLWKPIGDFQCAGMTDGYYDFAENCKSCESPPPIDWEEAELHRPYSLQQARHEVDPNIPAPDAVSRYVLVTRQMIAARPNTDEGENAFCDELETYWKAMTPEQMTKADRLVGDDEDVFHMDEERLRDEVLKLRAGIRIHRDSSGHDLCWYVPELWNLLPEKVSPEPKIPRTEEFLGKCAKYRSSLDT